MTAHTLNSVGKLFSLLFVFLLTHSITEEASANTFTEQHIITGYPSDTGAIQAAAMNSNAKVQLLVDQANEVLQKQFSYNIDFLKPIGQEFFPTLHALDAVELFIDDASCSETGGQGGSLRVVIHEGTINGPVVGTSEVTGFPSCFYNILRFEFPSFVPVTPGKKYVIEPVYVSGNTSTVYVDEGPSSLYKPGGLIFQGALDSDKDMWFREGLSKSIARQVPQARNEGWKKLVREDGTAFQSEQDCIDYIKEGK
ncbi:MAG TPA: hypothetical protein VD794_07350 [Flavisolibacter sp.]|nr:hypothetical protein [Flavisolibacter sp.]